jgi:hypothetical protein
MGAVAHRAPSAQAPVRGVNKSPVLRRCGHDEPMCGRGLSDAALLGPVYGDWFDKGCPGDAVNRMGLGKNAPPRPA